LEDFAPEEVKTIGLTVGLNIVDPRQYNGWRGELGGCVHDANQELLIAAQLPGGKESGIISLYSRQVGTRVPGKLGEWSPLHDQYDAAAKRVDDALAELAKETRPRDNVYVSFSSHGTRYVSGGAIVLADRTYSEYELRAALARFPAESNIYGFYDLCYAGEFSRGAFFSHPKVMPRDVVAPAQKMLSRPKAKIVANVVMFMACKANQTAGDTALGGVFTLARHRIWNSYTRAQLRKLTPRRWFEDTARFMAETSPEQTPLLDWLGDRDITDKPFFH
jgi:hypothetical protein